MDFRLNPDQEKWAAKIAEFAKSEIAPGADDRDKTRQFPRELWKRMSEMDLLGLLVPSQYGGVGTDFLTTAVIFESFARHGHDMGLCISLTVTTLYSHFQLLRHGSEELKKKYLPAIVSSEKIPAFAVSERERGAHPRYLKTVAEPTDSGYSISGRKMYITNGPVADFVTVFAITERLGDRNGISAFIVDKETPGFYVGEIMDLDFCRSSPHSELVFESCCVPEENMLGEKNNAFDRMVRGVREIEDSLGMAASVGFLQWQLELADAWLERKSGDLSGEQAAALSDLASILEGARISVYRIAWLRDMKRENTAEFADVHSYFPTLIDSALASLNTLFATKEEVVESGLERPLRDMKIVLIGRNVAKVRKQKLAERIIRESTPEE